MGFANFRGLVEQRVEIARLCARCPIATLALTHPLDTGVPTAMSAASEVDQAMTKKTKNDIRDVRSTADLVLVLLVHLVHWYLVHLYQLLPDST